MNLNEKQYEAVFSTTGPVVVCAGAGSGKTRVITYRVLHLINSGVHPSHIVCVTFTNKAAVEMKERITDVLSEHTTKPTITTFHGYALQLLRTYGESIGIESFSIIGEAEQILIIKNILAKLDIKDKTITPKKILSTISFLKNNYFDSSEYYTDINQNLFQKIYSEYESEKKKSSVFDFDDLLILALKILRDPDILAAIRAKTKHIMIDEYQDTNSIQHLLVKKLSLNTVGDLALGSIFVVGDEDQSIYSWRGANVANILNFKNDFENTKFISLTQNYRSTNAILSVANQVIQKNKTRNIKNLWTENNSSIPVCLVESESGFSESGSIIRSIKKLQRDNKIKTCAILYRSHYQSRLFEESCIKNNVQYKVYGGINFYQRQEIKDILSYLYLTINQLDRHAFARCVNTPSRGIGEVAQQNFIHFWDTNPGKFLDILPLYLQNNKIPTQQEKGLRKLYQIISECIKITDPSEAIQFIINNSDYYAYIEKNAENILEVETRKENLQELIGASKTFVNETGGSLTDFVTYLSVLYNQTEEKIETSNEDKTSPILLMSIHAAKGLEFDTVFVVGLEDGIFPSFRATISQESIEEERRLFYVALTRAQKRLVCSYALSRTQWGKYQSQRPSLFIKDFDNTLITKLSCKNFSQYEIESILSDSFDQSNQNEHSKINNYL